MESRCSVDVRQGLRPSASAFTAAAEACQEGRQPVAACGSLFCTFCSSVRKQQQFSAVAPEGEQPELVERVRQAEGAPKVVKAGFHLAM